MAEVTLRRPKTSAHEFGISMPKKTIDRINAVKGPYITRSKFILRAVDKVLQEEEEKLLSDAHSSAGTPEERQAAVATTTKPRTRGGGSRSNG
jgi:metal-responsive CopG/Arc/MetJ family transcriptional regulator